jgi:hypothetical protein
VQIKRLSRERVYCQREHEEEIAKLRLQHKGHLEAQAQDTAVLTRKLEDACARVDELKVDMATQVLHKPPPAFLSS